MPSIHRNGYGEGSASSKYGSCQAHDGPAATAQRRTGVSAASYQTYFASTSNMQVYQILEISSSILFCCFTDYRQYDLLFELLPLYPAGCWGRTLAAAGCNGGAGIATTPKWRSYRMAFKATHRTASSSCKALTKLTSKLENCSKTLYSVVCMMYQIYLWASNPTFYQRTSLYG